MKKTEVRFPLGKFVPIWHAINRGRITVAVGQYKRKEKLVCYSRTFFFFFFVYSMDRKPGDMLRKITIVFPHNLSFQKVWRLQGNLFCI